ncbi:MAG: hypothetical protein IPG45_30610 [Deltaproteobacteria bacterium]|nr:hypothetical protein [Deltaproteobacteria bacterium]
MSEVVFPLLGTVFVVLAVLPASALLAKLLLLILDRSSGSALHGLEVRYLILICSTALPLAWFLSAGLHQAETGQSVVACLFNHSSEGCLEPVLFASTLLLVMAGLSSNTFRRSCGVALISSPRSHQLQDRIEAILRTTPWLDPLQCRVAFTDTLEFALGTQGLLSPQVVVGIAYAEATSDEALAAALGHEAEHLRSRDPLRYLLLALALAMNPFGRWLLGPDARRWLAAREAHCDREAVVRGAAPLFLAEALVQAARPEPMPRVGLGAQDASMLKLRVGLLLAYAEQSPVHCCRREPSTISVALSLLCLFLFLPHQTSTAALDVLHAGAERAHSFFWN